jgi:hypothetical protein
MPELLSAPWFGNLLTLLALAATVAIPVTSYVYERLRNSGKQIKFSSKIQYPLGQYSDSIPDRVRVLFDDQPIQRLTRVEVKLWNNGSETLKSADLTAVDPLRIEAGQDGKILSCDLIKQSRPGINAISKISADNACATLSFDFLDPSDGFKITLLHTSKTAELRINGTIIGMPAGPERTTDKKDYGFLTIIISPTLLALVGAILISTIGTFHISSKPLSYVVLIACICLYFSVYNYIGNLLSWRSSPKSLD